MSREYVVSPLIERIAKPTLQDRKGVSSILNWMTSEPVEQDKPSAFEEYLAHFDRIINTLNSTDADKLPADCVNFRKLKKELKGRKIPTINFLLHNSSFSDLFRFKKTIAQVNRMMRNGERPPDQQGEIYLAFQTGSQSPDILAVGAIFHVFEEYILQHIETTLPRSLIEGALIEVLPELENNPLWNIVSGKEGLNWVDKWEGFAGPFRKRHNLT